MNRVWPRWAAVLGTILLVMWHVMTSRPPSGQVREDAVIEHDPYGMASATDRDEPSRPPSAGQHPLAAMMERGGVAPEEEPGLLLDLFQALRRSTGRYPSAEDNAALVRQLTREEAGHPALISPGHARINEKGELVDGWGTPYFFHHVSAHTIEIRSAGPDRQMYSADDIVVPPSRPAFPGGGR